MKGSFAPSSSQAAQPDCRSAGFSLIELLVVIGVLGILLALLLPVLSRAKEQAKTVKCLSNLRQIGQAIYAYAVDNRGLLPAWSAVHYYPDDPPYLNNPVSDNYAGPGWPVLLANYIGQTPDGEIYHCPAFADEPPRTNYFLSARWMYLHQPLLRTIPLSRIKTSSRFILCGDCNAPAYYPETIGMGPQFRDDIDKDDGAVKCLLFWTEVGGYKVHAMGNNVLFADGHCENKGYFDPSSMTYSPDGNATWENVEAEQN